jgi:hypothetical protein
MPSRAACGSLIAMMLIIAAPAGACDTPVFRVAMFDPRWRPHAYEVTIIRDGKLPRAEQKILERLDDFLDRHAGSVNYALEVVDLAKQQPADLRDLLKVRRPRAAWPQLVLSYPALSRVDANLWVGPVKDAPLYDLLESPMRREIARRLVSGETAVWVLIESGNKARDDAAFALLSGELKELQTTLKLPEIGPGGKKIPIPEWAPPARVAFSVLRLPRTDPAERWFVAMLLGLESDLDSYASQPIVFTVFGRGNTLEPLVGKGITAHNIGKAVAYLTGPCICEDKAANPVKDLLMIADWEDGRTSPSAADWFTPGAAGSSEPQAPADASQPTVTDTSAPADRPGATERDAWLLQGMWLGVGLGLLAITAIGLLVVARRKRQ